MEGRKERYTSGLDGWIEEERKEGRKRARIRGRQGVREGGKEGWKEKVRKKGGGERKEEKFFLVPLINLMTLNC